MITVEGTTITYTKGDNFYWTLPISGATPESSLRFIISSKNTDNSDYAKISFRGPNRLFTRE